MMPNDSAVAAPPMKRFQCPNGLGVWNAPAAGGETRFIFDEIFERRCYERHGVSVKDGDVVIDVGANVGLFALSMMQRYRNLTIVCAEPVPDTRACLVRNVAESPWQSGHRVVVVPTAVGADNREATISYFRRAPGNSTLDPAVKRAEWSSLFQQITPGEIWRRFGVRGLPLLALYPWRGTIFNRFVAPVLDDVVAVACQIRTLSDTMRGQGLDHVDLLKIDVEGAELEVLEGIERDDWPKIRQLAMEVAPASKVALPDVERRLRSLGFTKVAIEGLRGAPASLLDGMPCMLFAAR
jgi:FkbM family methyltransferase